MNLEQNRSKFHPSFKSTFSSNPWREEMSGKSLTNCPVFAEFAGNKLQLKSQL